MGVEAVVGCWVGAGDIRVVPMAVWWGLVAEKWGGETKQWLALAGRNEGGGDVRVFWLEKNTFWS